MKPGTKKAAREKTMRVATIFTGAAACVTGFGPAAVAGTAGAGHHVRPMLHTGGHITSHPCPRSTSYPTWVHMDGAAANIMCYGFTGTTSWKFYNSSVTAMCGGNNVGWYSGSDIATGTWGKAYFHEGTSYVPLPGYRGWNLANIHVSGWSGNDKCSF